MAFPWMERRFQRNNGLTNSAEILAKMCTPLVDEKEQADLHWFPEIICRENILEPQWQIKESFSKPSPLTWYGKAGETFATPQSPVEGKRKRQSKGHQGQASQKYHNRKRKLERKMQKVDRQIQRLTEELQD